MAEQMRPPEEMQFKGDIANNWKLWKQKFNLYLLATGKTNKPDDVKIAILLNLLGDEGLHIFNTLEFDGEGDSANSIETVLKKFDEYCSPVKNAVYEHFKFFKRDQHLGETIDQFVTALKQLSATCEFKELKDTLIRDRLVLGVRDSRIQEKLLQHADLKLSDAIQICRAMESSAVTQEKISNQIASVCTLNSNTSRRYRGETEEFSTEGGGNSYNGTQAKRNHVMRRWQQQQRSGSGAAGTASASAEWNGQFQNFGARQPGSASGKHEGKMCSRCGYSHQNGKCLAINRYCSRCNQRGHYRKFCHRNMVYGIDNFEQNCDELSTNSDSESYDDNQAVWTVAETHCLKIDSIRGGEWFEDIQFFTRNAIIQLKIDTGSQANVLNFKDFLKLNIPKSAIIKTSAKLESYSGHKIFPLGKIKINCAFGISQGQLDFYILDKPSERCSLLGLKGAKTLQLLQVRDKGYTENCYTLGSRIDVQPSSAKLILNKYQRLFSGHGKMKKLCRIVLKENAIPKVCAARKIPFALKSKVKQKLDEMINENIIAPITEPTDWVHPIVIVPKPNNDIRVCMDPRALNQYIKRELFPIPTTDCLFNEVAGAKFFTLLDASQAFLQIPLDEDSSKLCTIATPWGRFRYLRLPYGISSAPEIFQRYIQEILEGVEGVIAYFDDILVFGATEQEHNTNLDTNTEETDVFKTFREKEEERPIQSLNEKTTKNKKRMNLTIQRH
nr:unnamed protein product [Callosobruchus analis]